MIRFAGAAEEKDEVFVMAQVNDQDRFGGPYMIQDRDHMSEVGDDRQSQQWPRPSVEQSQSEVRQQGGDDQATIRKAAGNALVFSERIPIKNNRRQMR